LIGHIAPAIRPTPGRSGVHKGNDGRCIPAHHADGLHRCSRRRDFLLIADELIE
jgi:hypothetical protein